MLPNIQSDKYQLKMKKIFSNFIQINVVKIVCGVKISKN